MRPTCCACEATPARFTTTFACPGVTPQGACALIRPSDTKTSGAAVPQALTDYIAERSGYDYNEHGRAGNAHTAFVPDSIIDRFCIIGPPEVHIERLKQLEALGVDQFSIYLQHDAKESTLAAYGNVVLPAVREHVRAKA